MANKSLFSSLTSRLLPQADARNEAGGLAYELTPEQALAQYAFTGCLNGTFYTDAEDQLAKVMELCLQVDTLFLAQVALQARASGFMKDLPALLCAVLAVRDGEVLEKVFDRVIDNGRMLRNFVQILRSGVTGRCSLGTRPKRLVLRWLAQRSDEAIFRASVGNDPSLADIVKMVHPKPATPQREALYAWLLGKPHQAELPELVQHYEAYKARQTQAVPDVPFQYLTSLDLGRVEWTAIAWTAGWHMTRMNLNTFLRHGVFDDPQMVALCADRLRDRDCIAQAKVFPYQIMTAYLNTKQELPRELRDALHDALEAAVANVPRLPGKVCVAVDVSGSMHGPVTGYRRGATSVVRCIDVASLIAAAILRRNRNTEVIPFSDRTYRIELEPRDTVMTNAKTLMHLPSGGTDCSLPLKSLNERKAKADLVVFVSDYESWIDTQHRWRGSTGMLKEWRRFRTRNPKAKLVCIDLQPHGTGQAPPGRDVVHVGGFSDQVFRLLEAVATESDSADHWVDEIRATVV